MFHTRTPCADGLPNLLLVEPGTEPSIRAIQLAPRRFYVTQTNSAQDIYLMRHALRFTFAVLSDQLGTASLCAVAESVRWQWPFARILILGRVPATMKDQLYDDVAVHSVDEDTFLSAIGKLAEDPWNQRGDPLPIHLQGSGAPRSSARAMELRESDPTKIAGAFPRGMYERDLPADQYRSSRRGHYAFPPSS